MILSPSAGLKQDEIPVLEVNYEIASYLLDPEKRLSIPSLFALMVEVAHRDAGRRGWGYSEMIRENRAWVFLRSLIRVTRWPVWGETVTIRTWPKSMEGIAAYRDFQFKGPEGQLLVSATTVWSLIDLEARKPLRMNGEEFNTGTLAATHSVQDKPSRLVPPPGAQSVRTFQAQYYHSDMNRHINNARYIDRVLSEFPAEFLEADCREIEVNFNSELYVGDPVEVVVGPAERRGDPLIGLIRNLSTGQQAFAMALKF